MVMVVRVKMILLLLSFAFSFAKAQTTAKEINAIKRDTAFLTAEDTNPDREEAISNAKAKLEVIVSEWAKSAYSDKAIKACVAKAEEHCSLIETMRGNLIRAFMYVKKSSVFPVDNTNNVLVVKVNSSVDSKPKEEVQKTTNENIIVLTDYEKQMKNITDFYDIEPFVKKLQSINLLNAYGKYSTIPAHGKCNILVYNRAGRVVSSLRRESSGFILNLNTLKEDDIKNYEQCGAIWLQIK